MGSIQDLPVQRRSGKGKKDLTLDIEKPTPMKRRPTQMVRVEKTGIHDRPQWQSMKINLRYSFVSDIDHRDLPPAHTRWSARLQVEAKDIDLLLAQGFGFSEANVHTEDGYLNPDLINKDWSCSRVFKLSNEPQKPEWTGVLQVLAHDTNTLADFKIEDQLVRDNISDVTAWDDGGKCIYSFERERSAGAAQAVQPLPFTGVWTLPHKETIHEKEDTDEDRN